MGKIDKKRLKRQEESVDLLIQNNGRGTVVYPTGVGKTMVAILAAKVTLKKNPNRKILIIVPTIQLKDQWEKIFKKNNIKATVYVVNTAIKLKLSCDFLILDEMHRYASEEFSAVLSIPHKFILGLTATLQRPDGRHILLEKIAPVIDEITMDEAREEGYIADFIEYNLAVPLSANRRAELSALDKGFHKHMPVFGYNLKVCFRVLESKEFAISFAQSIGWEKDDVVRYAAQALRYMRLRKSFLYNAVEKTKTAIGIAEKFEGKKIITFSQEIEPAEEIHKYFPDTSVVYHSDIKSEVRKVSYVATRKTESGAMNYAKKVDGIIHPTEDGFDVEYKKDVKVGPSILKKEAIRKFIDNRYKVNLMCTAKALDQGFDVPDIDLGIIQSGSSSKIQHTQRTGRVVRRYEKKGVEQRPIVVNLYIPESQDYRWLINRQTNSEVYWIDSIDQITYDRALTRSANPGTPGREAIRLTRV